MNNKEMNVVWLSRYPLEADAEQALRDMYPDRELNIVHDNREWGNDFKTIHIELYGLGWKYDLVTGVFPAQVQAVLAFIQRESGKREILGDHTTVILVKVQSRILKETPDDPKKARTTVFHEWLDLVW